MKELKVPLSYYYNFCGHKTDFKITCQQARQDLVNFYGLNPDITDLEIMSQAEKASGYKGKAFYKVMDLADLTDAEWEIIKAKKGKNLPFNIVRSKKLNGWKIVPSHESVIGDIMDHVIFTID